MAAPESAPRRNSCALSSLKSNLTCSICQGYLIDATTITECMHTFCKSCLLQRVENGRSSCPRCGIQVQRSRLSEQLRLDHAVQALVYAAVPGLWQEEQRRRKHFVDHHPLSSSVAPKLQQPTCFSPTDPVSLSLDFIPPSNDDVNLSGPNSPQAIGRRYFRCPAAVAVHHFQKLLSLKFELPSHFVVEIYCSNEKLDPSLRLMDVAYKTSWTQEEPLLLEYKITRSQTTKTSLSSSVPSTVNSVVPHASTWRSKATPSTLSEPSGNVAPGVKRSSGGPASPTPAPSKPSKRARSEEESERKVVVVVPAPSDEAPVKRRGRKKKRKRKSADLVPVMEPEHPLKVKIVERTKTAEWNRPSGVELLVQAAEFTSRQATKAPTPPPPPTAAEKQPTPPPPEPVAAKEAEITPTPAPTTPKRASSPPGLIPINPISLVTNTTDALNNNKNETEAKKDEEKPAKETMTTLADDEDDGHLMIADEVNSNENSRQSNGRDSGMANDDEEEDDGSSGALDLSSKSTRSTPPMEVPVPKKPPTPVPPAEQRKTSSPQLIQQRSTTLHSITDSLAQRQHQLLMQQRPPKPVPSDAIRNLILPPVPNAAVTQRFFVAMHQFAAAAAAAAAASPNQHRAQPKSSQSNKSRPFGYIRRPF